MKMVTVVQVHPLPVSENSPADPAKKEFRDALLVFRCDATGEEFWHPHMFDMSDVGHPECLPLIECWKCREAHSVNVEASRNPEVQPTLKGEPHPSSFITGTVLRKPPIE